MSDRELLEAAARAVGLIGEAEEFWTGAEQEELFAALLKRDGELSAP